MTTQPFPGYQEQLSTLENGLAQNNDVEVKAGDTVYSKDGEPVTLEAGAVVFDKDGNEVTYDGASPLTMKQLVVESQVPAGHLERWHAGDDRGLCVGSEDRLRQGLRRHELHRPASRSPM